MVGDILHVLKKYATLFCVVPLLCYGTLCFSATNVNQASKVVKKATNNVAKTATKTVANTKKTVDNAKKTATKTATKAVAQTKKAVANVKNAPKKVASKAFPNLAKKANNDKPKKKIKTKQIVIDCKIVAFARTASDAESLADAQAVSLSSGKLKPLIKDSTFITDTTGRIGCLKRMNYTDKIPENWYLETQMVVGFSSRSYEQAYNNAMQRSAQKVKSIVEKNSLGDKISDGKKSPSSDKVIAYDYVFARSGKEYYCRLFFRYMMPKN